MKNKHCRICWNTNGWRRPSGSAAETGGSYVATHGFGHEEWLFNYEWCIDGYKYGFLQPINKNRDSYEGQQCSVALYAKTGKHTFLVATIRDLYIPTLDELRMPFAEMNTRRWIEQMRDDVKAVGGDLAELEAPAPHAVINVRFRPSDVLIYEPMPVFMDDHKVSRVARYQAFDWDDESLPVSLNPDPVSRHGDRTRSELQRLRAGQEATAIDPQHVRLQNRLYRSLCKRHGDDVVRYEEEFVDLKVRDTDGVTFFEIKTDSSAKRCIRNAIGQLLEYSAYPSADRAQRWVVVGDAPLTSDECIYLKHIRDRFSLPVFYAQFDWETEDIGVLH